MHMHKNKNMIRRYSSTFLWLFLCLGSNNIFYVCGQTQSPSFVTPSPSSSPYLSMVMASITTSLSTVEVKDSTTSVSWTPSTSFVVRITNVVNTSSSSSTDIMRTQSGDASLTTTISGNSKIVSVAATTSVSTTISGNSIIVSVAATTSASTTISGNSIIVSVAATSSVSTTSGSVSTTPGPVVSQPSPNASQASVTPDPTSSFPTTMSTPAPTGKPLTPSAGATFCTVDNNYCKNGGTCVNQTRSNQVKGVCVCAGDYYGDKCDVQTIPHLYKQLMYAFAGTTGFLLIVVIVLMCYGRKNKRMEGVLDYSKELEDFAVTNKRASVLANKNVVSVASYDNNIDMYGN